MAAQAQSMPSTEASFRNLILNQRIDSTAQFRTAAVWKGCCEPVDMDRLNGRPCYAALDLSGSRDLTALVLAFPDEDGVVAGGLDQSLIAHRGTRRFEQLCYGFWRRAGWRGRCNHGRRRRRRSCGSRAARARSRFVPATAS